MGNKIVYLDTETTSLNPGQICELTMLIEQDYKLVDVKNYFFSVDKMDAGAQSVHHFSIEDLERLSNGMKFKDKFNEIYSILRDATIVAHNVPFDEKFICTEFWRCGVSFTPVNRFDTMEVFKNIMKIPAKSRKYGPYKNPKLTEVIQYMGISEPKASWYTDKLFNSDNIKDSGYHDSRFDATAMYIAVNMLRENRNANSGTQWRDTFGK